MGPDPGAAPGRSGNTPSGTLPWTRDSSGSFPKATDSSVRPPSCGPTVRAGDLHHLRERPCRLCQAQGVQVLFASAVSWPAFRVVLRPVPWPVLFCSVLHRILVSGRCSPDTSAQHAFPAHLPGTSARQPCLSPEQKPAGQSLCKACQPDRLCRDKRSDGTQTGHSLSRGRLPGGLGLRAFCLAALPAPPC